MDKNSYRCRPYTGEIVAETITDSFVYDRNVIGDHLDQTSFVQQVLADGTHEGTKTRQAISDRRAIALTPRPMNGRPNRDEAIELREL